MDLSIEAGDFIAKRLQLEPTEDTTAAKAHAVWKSHFLLSRLAAHKHYFTDYTRGCAGECSGFCKDLAPGCKAVKQRVASALLSSNAIIWEVWRRDDAGNPVDFCGILRLSEVEPGCNAKAHFMFFDSKLKDKTPLLAAWRDWVLSNMKLHRITVEVPANAFALAKVANRLGFGGDFEYAGLPVEGVLRQAKTLDGEHLDIMLMGYINGT